MINNVRNFIKKKNPTQIHWKCTKVAEFKNPNYNDQEGQKGINKNMKAKLSSIQGEYRRKKTFIKDRPFTILKASSIQFPP